MKNLILLIFTSLFICFAGQNAPAQPTAAPPEELQLSLSKTITLTPGEKKTFTVSLKKDGFAQISWLANDDLNLKLSFQAPSGGNLLGKLYVEDDISVVAPEDGQYLLTIGIGEKSRYDEETKISGPQRITLQYSNVFRLPKASVTKASRKVNGYDVRIVEAKGDSPTSFLLIEKLGKLKYILKNSSTIGFYFSDDLSHTYSPADKRSANLMRITPDKTGDGTPDIAVDYFSGGAHCCFDLHFFELGEDVKHIQPLETGDARTIAIGKSPTGGLRLETGDTTFTYWNIHFAGSPIPSVILDFKNGEFRPNFEGMKKPAPPLAKLQQMARTSRLKLNNKPFKEYSAGEMDDDEEVFEEAFWGVMLDLIYTGHEDLAWQYLDLVWKVDKPGKAIFREEFTRQLSESPFWQQKGK